MNRRPFIRALSGGLLAAPLAAEVQPAGEMPGLCFLASSSGLPRYAHSSFFQGLRDPARLFEIHPLTVGVHSMSGAAFSRFLYHRRGGDNVAPRGAR
jgi:hypothetical protein